MYVLLKKSYFLWFLENFGSSLVICGQNFSHAIKVAEIQCVVITSSIYLTKIFFYHECVYSYIQKTEKNAKNSRLYIVWAQIYQPAHRFFPNIWFEAINSKNNLVSHIFKLSIFKPQQKLSPFSPARCQPAPNIFPFGKWIC